MAVVAPAAPNRFSGLVSRVVRDTVMAAVAGVKATSVSIEIPQAS